MIRAAQDAVPPAKAEPQPMLPRAVRRHYETILHGLPWPAGGKGGVRTLGISSCQSGEGVSTVAAHLAVTAASMVELRVLLVDANFARPCVPRIFGVAGRPGLAEVLQAGCDLSEALQKTPADNLSLLVAGRPSGRHSRMYADEGWAGLIKELANDFQLVVFDLPAAGQSSAGLRLAGQLDGVLLVVEAGRVPAEAAQRANNLLVRAGARPLGAVLNKWQE